MYITDIVEEFPEEPNLWLEEDSNYLVQSVEWNCL